MTRRSLISETLAETLHGRVGLDSAPVPQQRRLLAGLTAGAVALSIVLASAMPVRAGDNRDLIKALAAIAVVGVIAAEANREPDVQQVDHRPEPWRDPWRDDWRDDWQDDRDEDWNDGWRPPYPPYPPRPAPVQRARIPGVCAIEIEARDNRNTVVYAESCLRKHGIDHLPRACGREIRFYGRKDRVYSQACLHDAGFRFGKGERDKPERPD